MKKKKLGKQGPEISVVGYGAWEAGGEHYGPNPSEEEVIEAIHTGLDAGMDWIDTAEVYGMGESERLVGLALEGRRDDVFVATKVAPKPPGTGFAPDEIRQACEASLRRLNTDRIDLYQLHWPDSGQVPLQETWEAMGGLVEEGLVRYIGVSNFPKPFIETLLSIRHVDSLQPEFSLLFLDLRDVIDWCGTKGIGVVAYGPLAYGVLTGAVDESTQFHERDWRSGKRTDVGYYDRLFQPDKLKRALAVVDGLRPIADRLGITLSQLSLAWVFHQKGVTSAIAGSRNPKHVRENAAAGDVELDEKTLLEIEDLIPLGPEFSG
jgi:aryl-alcohol dehydrogenase-like predicted oxidoreductase